MRHCFTGAKRSVILGALILAVTAGVFAQIDPTKSGSRGKDLTLDQNPKSAIKGISYRFGNDIDDYMDVVSGPKVSYDKWFVFLGGSQTLNGSGIQGGMATKLGGGHFGVYFNGNFFSGEGEDKGLADSSKNYKEGQDIWKDTLSILYASESIGGIKFNLLFNGSKTSLSTLGNGFGSDENKANETTASWSDNFTTSIQWGKAFGEFTPKATIGFQWPAYYTSEDSTITSGDKKMETWENAVLGVKLEASYNLSKTASVSGDYQLTVNFGDTQKGGGDGYEYDGKKDGYIDNKINLYLGKTIDIDEKLQLKVRPQLQFEFWNSDHEYTVKNKNNSLTGLTSNGTTINAPGGWFTFAPIVELGAKYAFSPKVNIYTGLQATLIKVRTDYDSDYKYSDTNQENKNKPSSWSVASMAVVEPGIGLQIKPSDAFSIDIGLNNTGLAIGSGGINWNWTTLSGKLSVTLKPKAAPKADTPKAAPSEEPASKTAAPSEAAPQENDNSEVE